MRAIEDQNKVSRQRIVIITGADSGLGMAFAERFIASGEKVILVVQEDKRFEVERIINARQWNINATVWSGEIVKLEVMDALIEWIQTEVGCVDILVNNAGTRMVKEFNDIIYKDWKETMEINLMVPFFLSQKIAMLMRRSKVKGAIVNIASQLGIVAARDHSLYCISKGGLISMTKSLALELARYGISVNAVAPGTTNTAKAGLLGTDDDVIEFLQRMPLGRRIEPSEVADAVVFLASNPGGAITGHTLVVDGGWTLW